MPFASPLLVVPCFNEAKRFDAGAFRALVPDCRLLLVDDGSTDETGTVLSAFAAAHGERVSVLTLARNGGKAEAVRQGMREAIARGASETGYLDADLATPPDEALRLLGVLRSDPALSLVMGARVARMGARIERSGVRHYLGRVFATGASMLLGLPIYDTQCGAKWFRVNDTLAAALDEPFESAWAFDVELLARLLDGVHGVAPVAPAAIHEEPLRAWRDVGASKVTTGGMMRAAADLARMSVLRGRRAARR